MADGLNVSIKMEGGEAVAAMLGKLGLDMKDLRGAMHDVGTNATTFFSGNVFASRGSVIGERWAPLNARYAVHKARRWPGRPPLVRTGLMQRSFRSTASSMHVTITNAAPYFRYHQSAEARHKIPRRVMLKLTDRVVSDAKALVAKSLADKIKARTA